MTNEIKCLQDLESTSSELLINAEIELSIDNSKVVQRIFQYKRMRDMLDDLIYDMNQEYRQELDEYLEQNQTVYVS